MNWFPAPSGQDKAVTRLKQDTGEWGPGEGLLDTSTSVNCTRLPLSPKIRPVVPTLRWAVCKAGGTRGPGPTPDWP